MKTMIKVSLLVLGLLVSNTGYSDSIDVVSTTVTGSKSFRLTLQEEAMDVQISLKDQDGYTLYQEHVSGQVSYDRVFNVSSLPAGRYQLELEYPTKHQVLPVEIKSNQVSLDNSRMEEYFKPIVRQKGSKVSVNLLNVNNGTLNILVYDGQTNDLLIQRNLKGELTMGKQFDFSNAAPGNYIFSMAYNGRKYSQAITIDE